MNWTKEGILQNLGFDAFNEMQEQTIDLSSEHSKIILLSNTGSGKTVAFLISLLQRIKNNYFSTEALIISPTRELAVQIEQVWKQMGTGLKVSACYGGHKREVEENNLQQAPKLIIGTPGRLGDHLRRGNINPSTIHSLVLDEFDKSMEYGYTEEIKFILDQLTNVEFRLYTSATKPEAMPDFSNMQDAEELNFINETQVEWDKILYYYTRSKEEEKGEDLFKLLCQLGEKKCIIFFNHKEAVERMQIFLKEKRIHNIYYHGSMEQRERDAALAKFRNGSVYYLLTTDLASRGLDIDNVRYVIHYQMPHTEDVYTHRNGRTARMESSGSIIAMYNNEQELHDYLQQHPYESLEIETGYPVPEKPTWVTLFIPHGKKNKVNKGDIVGFMTKTMGLRAEEVGLIEVKDFHSFVAVRRSKAAKLINDSYNERIKGKLVKLEVQK